MRTVRPPRTEPAPGNRILTWAREAQQTFRDISAALGEISLPRSKAVTTQATGSSIQSFQLLDVSVDSTKKIRVIYGTLAGLAPSGFSPGDTPAYILTVTGSGSIWAGITIDGTGAITSRFLDKGEEFPENEDDTFYIEIGSYDISDDTLTIAQSRYGPIDAQICRNWYAAEAPFFGVNWS